MENNKRIVSIDRYRGFLVFLMILFQYLERYDCFGILSKMAYHTPSLGIEILPNFALPDLFASCYYLILSLTFRTSFEKSVKQLGLKGAYLKFIKRCLEIFGLGSCICACDGIFYGFNSLLVKVEFLLTIICAVLGLLSLVEKLLKNRNTILAKAKPYLHFVLMILGAVGLIAGTVFWDPVLPTYDSYYDWGVLQAIGSAELIALPFITLSTIWRAIAAVIFIVLYALLHSLPNMMEFIDWFIQGGFIGAFSWASMILTFTVVADFYYFDRNERKNGKKSHRYLIAMIILDVFGCFAAKHLYLNRGSVNTGYVLLTMAFAVTTFYLFSLTENFKPKFSLFVWWGESPVFLFLLQYLFVNIPTSIIPGADSWSLVPATIYGVILMVAISWIAYRLDKKGNRIRF